MQHGNRHNFMEPFERKNCIKSEFSHHLTVKFQTLLKRKLIGNLLHAFTMHAMHGSSACVTGKKNPWKVNSRIFLKKASIDPCFSLKALKLLHVFLRHYNPWSLANTFGELSLPFMSRGPLAKRWGRWHKLSSGRLVSDIRAEVW